MPPSPSATPSDIAFQVDGRTVRAPAGLTLAAALLENGIRALRRSPVDGAPRGAFCHMGVCQECVVSVDGRRVRACCVTVRPGMAVTLGDGHGG